MIDCWYKTKTGGTWSAGSFHKWSTHYEEFESGPGPFPAAIVEDSEGGVHVVFAEFVSFSPIDPGSGTKVSKELVADLMKAPYKLPSKRRLMTDALAQGRKFTPRLLFINQTQQWAAQVHPQAIEMFTCEGTYLCQVRWIDGALDYHQGGLPHSILEKMFREAGQSDRA